jgi:hypothetical protein
MALMATRSTSIRQRLAVCGVAAAVMTCLTACGKAGQRFAEGPVLSDCEQQLGVAGESHPVLFTAGGVAEPNAVVELATNCDVGVEVAISQPDFKVVGGIHTKDGAYQAVAIDFQGTSGANGTLTVSQHGHRLGQMTLLSQYAPPSSGQPSFCDHLAHNCGS